MEKHFLKWLVNTIAIMIAIRIVPGISYTGDWWGILAVGVLFGLINTIIRPFIKLFTFPLLIFTLGLFTFVINAFMLIVTSWFSEKLALGFYVQGFKPAFYGALIISVVSLLLTCLIPPKEQSRSSI